MDRLNEYLDRLNRRNDVGSGGFGLESHGFQFRIDTDDTAPALLVTDRWGEEIYPPEVSGAAAQVVKIMESDVESTFEGTKKGKAKHCGLVCNLWRVPYVMYPLVLTGNVYGYYGEQLKVAPESHRLLIEINEVNGDSLQATLGVIHDDGGMLPVRLLTDSFVLGADTIYPIQSVGDNFASLHIFLQIFKKDMLPTYLAALYSLFRNFDLRYFDAEISLSPHPIECIPTLIFERVERDKTLVVRVSEQVHVGDDRLMDGALDYYVNVPDHNRIIVRKVHHVDMKALVDEVHACIRSFAPGRAVKKELFCDGTEIFVPEEAAANFLLRGLPQLLEKYRIIGLDRLREYKIKPLHPHLRVSFQSGIDYLDATAEVEFGSQRMSLSELLKQIRKHEYVTLPDGFRGVLDETFVKRVERIFRPDKRGDDDKYRVTIFDLPEIERLVGELPDEPILQRPRSFYAGFSNLPAQPLELRGVDAELRAYQREGVKWMKYLYDNGIGGCLADDMGLGKTLQAIGLFALTKDESQEPILLVMPRSLLFNWQDEIQKFAPDFDFHVYYGSNRNIDEALKHKFILTTYAVVRNDLETLGKVQFDTIVLDEAQYIKNVTANMTRSVYQLKGRHRFALSGTPVENNLTELYSLFHFLNPEMFGTLDEFNERYGRPIQKDEDREAMEVLRRRIFPFMLRRLKRDVLCDLPDRVDQTIYVEPDAELAAFYDRRRRFYLDKVKDAIASDGVAKSQFMMLQAMSELRRIASVPESLSDGQIESPKIEWLTEHIISATQNGHKVVVFFQFIAGIELLGEKLDEHGIDYASMTGSTRDRKSVVERFQTDPDCKVLMMTLKTGGVGLNLTAADMVFIAEPWWNRAAEEQAINRLHRIGQKSTVFTFSIITRGTIEEKILHLQKVKAELFDNVIVGDEISSKALTEEDINFILG